VADPTQAEKKLPNLTWVIKFLPEPITMKDSAIPLEMILGIEHSIFRQCNQSLKITIV